MVIKLRTPAPDADQYDAYCRPDQPNPPAPDMFFNDEVSALDVCNNNPDKPDGVCPMRDKCLFFALKNNEAYGVWGGMLAVDRTELRRFNPEREWKWHPPIERDEDGKPVSSQPGELPT